MQKIGQHRYFIFILVFTSDDGNIPGQKNIIISPGQLGPTGSYSEQGFIRFNADKTDMFQLCDISYRIVSQLVS